MEENRVADTLSPPSKLALIVSQIWGLIDLPLRASIRILLSISMLS